MSSSTTRASTANAAGPSERGVPSRPISSGPSGSLRPSLPVLNDGATITNVTSELGAPANLSDRRCRQLADPWLTREQLAALMEECAATAAKGWGTDAYGVSKAALNALTRILAREVAPRGIRVNATCPGWVRTDMGGRHAPLSATESVAGMRQVIYGLDLWQSGRFFAHDGTAVPW